MRLIVLNLKRGHDTNAILQFVDKKSESTDIFCFQEVLDGDVPELKAFWNDDTKNNYNLLSLLKMHLPQHASYFHPHLGQWAGIAMFVRKDVHVAQSGDVFVFKERWVHGQPLGIPPAPRNIQHVTFQCNGKIYTVINFHGLWDKQGKVDTSERIEQSQKIITFIQSLPNPYILCGDFNLVPTNRSFQMLIDELHIRDLISEYGITSTRPMSFNNAEKFADYVMPSEGIEVIDFKILQDEVSDHLPLYLEFS